ncbi:MAG: T9SS type A sorting domain-containing protein [Marinilabiliaceae bacterium]|nr:T9SS type A sorting domain-containing protein [Marinilabiliaceae bacterium]
MSDIRDICRYHFLIHYTNGLIRIKIYKPVSSNVGVKVQAGDSGSGAALELKQENKLVNAWEVMDFDFSALTGSSYSRLVIMPDFSDPRTTAVDVYIDDIEFFPLANAVAKTELDDSKVYASNDRLICKSKAPITELIIHSMTGAQVLLETHPTGDINISGLGKGLYLVVLKSGNTFSSFKVIR